MTPIREKVVASKTGVIREMMAAIATLPLESRAAFLEDDRMVAAGESFLRRCLEALLDLGRHILAKGFGTPVVEYREIGRQLGRHSVLGTDRAALLVEMGGYRNRLTHFYDEVTPEELYELLTTRLADVEDVLDELLQWLRDHAEKVDTSL